MATAVKEKVVVVGHGMVAERLLEKLVKYQSDGEGDAKDESPRPQFTLSVYGEESFQAYDRVNLTKYVTEAKVSDLTLNDAAFHQGQGIELHLGEKVTAVDAESKQITTESGAKESFDHLVFATGSDAYVPNIPGNNATGVFVYRRIDDLDAMMDYQRTRKATSCVVLGGGLLGLEAAQACQDLPGMKTVHCLQRGNRLMNRQLDPASAEELRKRIVDLGCKIHLNASTEKINSDASGAVCSVSVRGFEEDIEADMVVLSVGIVARDDVAKGVVRCDDKGGIIVNDDLETSVSGIYAIGECAVHNGKKYGIVAPGYDMADCLARKLCCHESPKSFTGADTSTKLKLHGVDVATFGEYSLETSDPVGFTSMVFHDPFSGIYRRLTFDSKGERLIGGILVGDAADYGMLVMKQKSKKKLKVSPGDLLPPPSMAKGGGGAGDVGDLEDDAQICSCNDVTKGTICKAVEEGNHSVESVGNCTKAGKSCGACKPLVKAIVKCEMEKLGLEMSNHVCEHFKYSRKELFHIAQVKVIKTFADLFKAAGSIGDSDTGCEKCKPVAASIFASLWNEHIVEPHLHVLQDTNDRFLANIQRGGTFSVIPRVAGGEITPEKLAALATTAKRYGLYCKITGGQRIDLLGAAKEDLPDIWEELIEAGFESGHAYGKALRTVKSCVGANWCRYGMRDSVGFAIEIENRYRGIRSPHKLKGGVSGCLRECAEAQSKDFGLIAAENGYNIYLGGNGGSKPRHATLFASGVKEADCIKYLDRYLMFYIRTADHLQRTARWLENLEGGIEYLRQVIIEDKLGIAAELDKQMSYLVDTYKCEWTETVKDPEKRARFRQFVNADAKPKPSEVVVDEQKVNTNPQHLGIEFIEERGQRRPADWPKLQVTYPKGNGVGLALEQTPSEWVQVANAADVPDNGGATVLYGKVQIAIFHFAKSGNWYATQNMCTHRNSLLLSQGLIAEKNGVAKVACPLHKKPFNLETGESIDGSVDNLMTFKTKVENGKVFLLLPPTSILDKALASEEMMIRASHGSEEKDAGCTSCSDDNLTW